jgi:hypothetical protein
VPQYRPLVAIPEFGKNAVCADDIHDQLLAWKAAVEAKGGKLVANSLTRTCAQQQPLRDAYVKYLNDLSAWEAGGKVGKAPTAVAAANKPGRSNHQGGRAIDVSTKNVFPGAPADKQIDLLWETGKPFGFTPIISKPDEEKSERWHFDCWNDWIGVKTRIGYETACMCSALDVGQAGEWQSNNRLMQALLLRAGYDIGEPDGIVGKRTVAATKLALGANYASKYPHVEMLLSALRALKANHVWVKVSG